MSWKKSLLLISKTLTLFVNTLTADDKYSLINRDTLTDAIQMQLSQKQKPLSEFFYAFLKFRLNFEHFPKNDNTHSRCTSEFTDSEIRG